MNFKKSANKFIKKKIQYSEYKELIDSNVDLMRELQLRNMFLNI